VNRAAIAAALLAAMPAMAQIPPSPAEVQRYSGLHCAAASGDVAHIKASPMGLA